MMWRLLRSRRLDRSRGRPLLDTADGTAGEVAETSVRFKESWLVLGRIAGC